MRKLKAWKTQCKAISDGWGIVKAESAGKAKYYAYLSATDAGFDVSITDFKALRAKDFDSATYCGKPIEKGQCYGMEYLKMNAE